MSHVSPDRWGAAFAGKVAPSERAEMEAHAKSCAECRRIRGRIARASDTFPTMREQAGPELPWDAVRARVHWSVSKERREHDARAEGPSTIFARAPRIAWAGLALAAVVAGTVVTVRMLRDTTPAQQTVAHAPANPPIVVEAPGVVPPVALAAVVSRMTGRERDIMIDGAHPAQLFARRLGPGSVIATGDGRVDVQFGEASAFALGPRSTLELRRFDARTIELRVDGTIDIDVGPRAAEQRFLVVAGDHTIEVRGTQFRVSREASRTTVACRHGLVVVRDRATQVDVAAARQIAIPTGEPLSAERVVPLSVDELAQLVDATPLRVPLWTDADTLLASTAPLDISLLASDHARYVRVDGIELGAAPLLVRVMPGRHTVEAADHAGRFRRVGWVDVATGAAAPRARLEVLPEPAPKCKPGAGQARSSIEGQCDGSISGDNADRQVQLRTGIDRTRLARCTRSLSKSGLTDTFVQVEIAVAASGAVSFLNVIDTDLPSSTAGCVREVLADVRFAAGAAATWRERIDL